MSDPFRGGWGPLANPGSPHADRGCAGPQPQAPGEWLLSAGVRARAAVDLLTFVYRDPGDLGDDRAYIIRRGTIRATFPYPTTPIETEAFRAAVAEELGGEEDPTGPLPLERLDEVLVTMAWFRKHPEALRRTTKLEEWVA